MVFQSKSAKIKPKERNKTMWDLVILNPMINFLLWIYSILGQNFGLAIIVFTILVNLLLYPLNAQQMKSTQAMQEMQKSKKWQDIQKKYKDDREKLAQEQMKFYKEMGISPFGSCLPMLIQFPLIIGLYQAVTRALAVTPVQLLDLSRHVYSFINAPSLIPLNSRFLWMELSQPERLYVFGVGVPVLTILVVITTYLSSKLMTPPPSGPKDQSAQMARSMNMIMPLMMGMFAYQFSAGLAIYLLAGNLFRIVQYALMGKTNWKNLLPGSKASS
jgi:YidC/Oxa1 family membrane protein insertase